MDQFDVIIVGAGHNGLGLASYLVTAGLKVLVVERREKVGGFLRTEEVTLPGFKHNLHAMTLGSYPPVYQDFDLSKYGVDFVEPRVEFSLLLGSRSLTLYRNEPKRNFAAVARYSKRDAQTLSRLHEKYYGTWLSEFYSPPKDAKSRGGSLEGKEGEEYRRVCGMNLRRAIDELFESDEVKLFLCLRAIELTGEPGIGTSDPAYDGTGDFLFRVASDPGYRLTVGGNQLLAEGLARLIKSRGGTVLIGSPVRRIIVRDNSVEGVELADGVYRAKVVVSNLDLRTTMLDLIGRDYLEKKIVRKMESLRTHPTGVFDLHLALREPPLFDKVDDDDASSAFGIYLGYGDLKDVDRLWNMTSRGKTPSAISGQTGCPTLYDPSYAPAGKHSLYFWQFMPLEPFAGGVTESDEHALIDDMLRQLRDYAPNINARNVMASYAYTLDKWPHGASGTRLSIGYGQYYDNRPVEDFARYRTTIRGLYLCSSDCHPGSSVRFAPGYNALQTIAEDLKLRRWWHPIGHSGMALASSEANNLT